jgi:hypothetical protein
VGFLDRLWKAISEVEFSDMPGSGADPEDARKRAHYLVPGRAIRIHTALPRCRFQTI